MIGLGLSRTGWTLHRSSSQHFSEKCTDLLLWCCKMRRTGTAFPMWIECHGTLVHSKSAVELGKDIHMRVKKVQKCLSFAWCWSWIFPLWQFLQHTLHLLFFLKCTNIINNTHATCKNNYMLTSGYFRATVHCNGLWSGVQLAHYPSVATCTRACANATGIWLLVDSSTTHVPLLSDSSTPAHCRVVSWPSVQYTLSFCH